MEIETIDARQLPPEEARNIAELIAGVWPDPEKTIDFRQQRLLDMGRNYRGPDNQAPRLFVLRKQGQVVAHAALLPRKIGTAWGDLTVVGLASVCVDSRERGQGLGAMIVRPVFELVDQGVFGFSLFQTSPEVQPFYEKLGACVIENTFVNSFADDPHATPFWNKVIMRYPADGEWPVGEIDLLGPGY